MSVTPPLVSELSDRSPAVPRHGAAPDLEIRSEQPEDVAGIRTVHLEAFGREAEALLVDALRNGPTWEPDLSLVALRGGELVGHVLLTDAVCAGRPVLAMAPLAVRPSSQGQGVGTALANAAIEAARTSARGLLVVLGDPAFYAQLGFRPSVEFGITNPFGAPSAHYSVLPLPAYAEELRGVVDYPPPFATL